MPIHSKRIAIIFALILFVCGYFYFQVDWEARAVRKQLSQVAELIEKDGAVSTFEALGRSRRLTGYFTTDAAIEYLAGRSLPRGSDAMGSAFLSVWGNVDQASVRLIKHEVAINDRGTEADSRVLASCSVVLAGAEQMGDTVQYRIYWRKIDGDWLIREVVAVGNR